MLEDALQGSAARDGPAAAGLGSQLRRPPAGLSRGLHRARRSHTRLADGRYNVLLLGLRRARWCASCRPNEPIARRKWRCWRTSIRPGRAERERSERCCAIPTCLRRSLAKDEPLEQLLSRQLPLGVLTDIVAFTVKFESRSSRNCSANGTSTCAPSCCSNGWPHGIPTNRACRIVPPEVQLELSRHDRMLN